HTRVEYVWRAERRGFFREALGDGGCDVMMGVPVGFAGALTTRAYYRSTYVFVTRRGSHLNLNSLDDKRLARLRVGVPLVGDGADAPPAHALARRGIVDGIRGYPVYGDYTQHDPPARLVADVAGGALDAAISWGPLAGWYAKKPKVHLRLAPVSPPV